jgi:hypothetical protein
MKTQTDWQQIWNARGADADSDYEFDHETAARDNETERFSEEELFRFIDAQPAQYGGRTVSRLTQGLMQVLIGGARSSSCLHADSLPLGI